jgi:hypothetical protein
MNTTNFFTQPVQFTLVQWCHKAFAFIDQMAYEGGAADEIHDRGIISHSKKLVWSSDILGEDTGGLAGELVRSCLQSAMIHHAEDCQLKLLARRSEVSDKVLSFIFHMSLLFFPPFSRYFLNQSLKIH